MRSIITLTVALAAFLGTQNVSAIRIQTKVHFVDDVIRMLDESEKKEASESKSLAECNPCPVSAAGPNPHYEAPGNAEARTADAAGAKDSAAKNTTAALAEIECNPCPVSAAGPNPHYSGAVPDKKEDKKEDKKAALSQVECNPCPNSSAGQNPHYPAAGSPAKTNATKALVQNTAIVDDSIPFDIEAVKAYSSVIADAAEDSQPENPVVYTETITE